MIDVERIDRALDDLETRIESLKTIDEVRDDANSLIQELSIEKKSLSELKDEINSYFNSIQRMKK